MENKKEYTVKEIAEILNVTPEALKKWVRELFPDIIKNGKTTLLNELHITEIKKHLRPTTKVVGVTTDLEMQKKALEVFQWMGEKIKELQKQIESDKPKVEFFNAVTDSSDCVDFTAFAKIIKIGRNKLFSILRAQKIIFLNNGYNVPYQSYIDAGYFRVIEEPYRRDDETKLGLKTLITPKGQIFLSRKLNQLSIGG